jgi:hypothetical protein
MEENVNRSGTDPVGRGGEKPFNKRAFVSIAMFIAALFLPVSGAMIHRLSSGPLTTALHFWMSVHNMAAFLFAIFAITHISYNWRCLIRYAKRVKGVAISREAVMAILLVACIVGLFSSHAFHVR